ncbi:hypothetical protein WCE03_04085 [Pseudomonas guariconensis]
MPAIQGHAPIGQHHALLTVVQRPGVDAEVAPCTDAAALVVQAASSGHIEVSAGNQLLIAVVHGTCVDFQVSASIATAIDRDTGLNSAQIAQLTAGAQLHLAAGGQALAVHQCPLAAHLQLPSGMHGALHVDALGPDAHVPAGAGLCHAQLTVSIKLDVASTGNHLAIKAHANTSVGPHQFHRAGIHAAKGAGVDRQCRFGTAVIGPRCGD